MLGKRTRPRPANITKLPDSSLMSGARFGFPETLTSPKCSLEYRILSPRSLKTSEQVAGIGLGIVAALEKSSSTASDVLPPPPIPMSGSKPIPISGNKAKEEDVECMESFTYVTSRIPEKSYSKVYQSVTEVGGSGHDRSGCEDMTWRNSSVFYESPPRRLTQRNQAFPMLDFLSSCYLCRKNLHGADIYMYRGEKAFCSTECRCKQIATDERKEKCGSEVSRSFDISTSPYTRENIFFTGIIAA